MLVATSPSVHVQQEGRSLLNEPSYLDMHASSSCIAEDKQDDDGV